jgi:hypothetical protein
MAVCREFHCLPSEAAGEDVEVLRLMTIMNLAYGGDDDGLEDME